MSGSRSGAFATGGRWHSPSGGDLEPLAAAGRIGDFWDKLGSLVRGGHVGREQITAQWAEIILIYWTMLERMTRSMRSAHGQPTEWEHFEWLVNLMLRHSGDHHRSITPLSAERIDAWIDDLDQSIAVEEELRALPADHQIKSPVAGSFSPRASENGTSRSVPAARLRVPLGRLDSQESSGVPLSTNWSAITLRPKSPGWL